MKKIGENINCAFERVQQTKKPAAMKEIIENKPRIKDGFLNKLISASHRLSMKIAKV